MKRLRWISLGLSILLFDGAVFVITAYQGRIEHPGPTLLVHGLLCVAFGGVIYQMAADEKRGESRALLGLAGSMNGFIPVFGGLAILAGVATLLATKRKVETAPLEEYRFPSLLLRKPPAAVRKRTTEARLAPLVRWGRSADARFKAVLASNNVPPAVAIPVLKAALADATEEVRLSAFSQLERARRVIDLRIEKRRERLKAGAGGAERIAIERALAEDYFEVAYLGLAEGEVYKHTLKAAEEHAQLSLGGQVESAPLYHLLGRIQLRRGDGDSARASFESARQLGYPRALLSPYLAEEAFQRGDYEAIPELLKPAGAAPHDYVRLALLLEFWPWH